MLKELSMKILNYNLRIAAVSVIFLFMLSAPSPFISDPLRAQEPTPAEKENVKGIRITTDQAVVDSQARYTEFKGNVSVTIDGDTQIHADWLKINFKPGTGKEKEPTISEKSFKEIIAKGHVKIIFDDKVAITQEALYIPDEDTLTLTGEGSKISTDKDYIIGDKITLNRKDGTFKVEGSGKKQVEAVFFPKP